MDARLTRDGLLKLELRLDPRQRQELYRRFEQLREERGEPLSDRECLTLLLRDVFVGDDGLVSGSEGDSLYELAFAD